MDLAPAAAVEANDARGADPHFESRTFPGHMAALAAYYVKDIGEFVESVIVKLKVKLTRAAEEALIYGANLWLSTFDSAERIVHRGLIRVIPVLFH